MDLIGQSVGRFKIKAALGAGGMGEVFLAEDTVLHREVAVKRLSPKLRSDSGARDQILKEARRASGLSSPYIASVHDVVEEGDELLLVMEYVEGDSLRRKMITLSPMRLETFLPIAMQCAEALSAAHRRGIIHRDIKPENIMITGAGLVKVLDFGLARQLRLVDEQAVTTSIAPSTSSYAGTPGYMAPEVLREEPVDARADIFSLGVVFYEMLTAEHPFRSNKAVLTTDHILHAEPKPLRKVAPGCPQELERIVGKMLAKKPEERYATAADVGVDLRRLPTAGGRRATEVRLRLRHTLWIAGLVAVFVLVSPFISERWPKRPAAPPKLASVVVADFEDRTSTPGLDQTLTEMLATTLEQSRYVTVFPSSRRADALQRMELRPDTRVDEKVGREIAAREGLQAVLTASVSRLGNDFVVLGRAVSPHGDTLASARGVAQGPDQLPAALDTVARNLRTGLGESSASVQTSSLPLAQVTSASLDAVRAFTTGKKLLYAGETKAAIDNFRRAAELDADFAMAYEYLGLAYGLMDDDPSARQYLAKAMHLLNRVTKAEQEKIQADYAALIRDDEAAIRHIQVLMQLRTDDPAAHLNLGMSYAARFDFDKAIAETNEAIRLQPDPSPRVNLAFLYFLKGDTGRALTITQELLRGSPHLLRAQEMLVHCYLSLGQSGAARQAALDLIAAGGGSAGRGLLADVALSGGHYEAAGKELRDRMVADAAAADPATAIQRLMLAEVTLTTGSREDFRAVMSKLPSRADDPVRTFLVGRMYARAKQGSRGHEELRRLQTLSAAISVPAWRSLSSVLRAEIAQAEGRAEDAVRAAEDAVRLERSALAVEALAHSYRVAGRSKDAAAAYEEVVARANERAESYDTPAYHTAVTDEYWLGVLCDKMGNRDGARRHLEAFLSRWQDADAKLEIYADAKRRMKSMGAVPPGAGLPTPAR